MKTTTVNIAFPTSLLHEIDESAKSESRNRSEFLREAARSYIQRKQRWADIFARGKQIAEIQGLAPEDVEKEIRRYRKARGSRT